MRTLKKGDKCTEVKIVQRRLSLMADGIFGLLTEEAVKEFQRSKGITNDGIVGPQTWSALNDKVCGIRSINKIILHCTATPEGEDFTVEQIRQMHLHQGYSDIGYHYLIGRDGTIYPGRPESIVGAHCAGHNTESIGVAYVGGCPARSVKNWQNQSKDTRTIAQKASLIKLLKALRARYCNPTVHGHNEFANKACPSFNAKKEYLTI